MNMDFDGVNWVRIHTVFARSKVRASPFKVPIDTMYILTCTRTSVVSLRTSADLRNVRTVSARYEYGLCWPTYSWLFFPVWGNLLHGVGAVNCWQSSGSDVAAEKKDARSALQLLQQHKKECTWPRLAAVAFALNCVFNRDSSVASHDELRSLCFMWAVLVILSFCSSIMCLYNEYVFLYVCNKLFKMYPNGTLIVSLRRSAVWHYRV